MPCHPPRSLQEVWGYEPDDGRLRRCGPHIRHLPAPSWNPIPRKPRFIKTVYGAGYCLELLRISDPKRLIPPPAPEPWQGPDPGCGE